MHVDSISDLLHNLSEISVFPVTCPGQTRNDRHHFRWAVCRVLTLYTVYCEKTSQLRQHWNLVIVVKNGGVVSKRRVPEQGQRAKLRVVRQ